MTRSRIISLRAALLLAAVACSTTSALYLPPQDLFERDSTCGTATYTQCTGSGLPDNFCCPAGDTCMVLAGNTTALCCPAGENCSVLQPIPCEITLEDKSLHPDNTIMTTALAGSLGHCGSGTCCPFGYSCNADGNCAKDANQNAVPIQSTGATTSTATATSSATGTATSGSASTTTAVNSVIPVASHASSSIAASTAASSSSATATTGAATGGITSSGSSGPSGGAIAGGVIGGLAGAVAIALLAYFLIRWRMRKNEEKDKSLKLHRSTSSFGNIINNPMTTSGSMGSSSKRPNISKPIPHPSHGFGERHDFVRSPPPRPSPGSINSYDTTQDHRLRDGSMDLDGLSPAPPRVPGFTFDTANRGDHFDPPTRMPRARDHGGDDVLPLGRRAYSGDARAVSPDSRASEIIDVGLDVPGSREDRLRPISNQTTFTDMIYQMEHADLVAKHGFETPPMPPIPPMPKRQ